MSLMKKLVTLPPRETAGAISASRFDFQKHWALAHMLKLHLAGNDYRILFDFHEDVVILEPSDNPTTIHFYQVKGTTKGHWTKGELLKRKAGKNGKLPSILGKLLLNQQEFEAETGSLNLISNARYKLKLRDNSNILSRDRVNLHGLNEKELETIRNAIKNELGVPLTCATDDITFLHVTSLSLTDYAAHVKGRLSEFLDKIYEEKTLPPQVMYKALIAEVNRKTGYECLPESVEALRQRKSLSRSDINAMLSLALKGETFKQTWNSIENCLRREGFNNTEVAALRGGCNSYLAERTDPTNSLLLDLTEEISTVFDSVILKDPLITNDIKKLFSAVEVNLTSKKLIPEPEISQDKWKSIILVVAYEKGKI